MGARGSPLLPVRRRDGSLRQFGRGAAMLRLRKSAWIGRQLAVAVLIFALMLQGLASAFATGLSAATVGSDINWGGFELCRHADGGTSEPGTAPDPSTDERHCIFCLAGATFVLGTTVHIPAFHTVVLTIAPWNFVAWRLPALTVTVSARPRGPPPAA